MKEGFLEVGQIVNTHGLRGEVRVTPWMDAPEDFCDLEAVYTPEGAELTIQTARLHKGSILATFDGIDSIEAAEVLKNTVLSVPREALGELPDGVYFVADLIGLTVRDESCEYGKISDVLQNGGADIYVVERSGQKDLLIPVHPDIVKSVDVASGVVTVALPEGLLEL